MEINDSIYHYMLNSKGFLSQAINDRNNEVINFMWDNNSNLFKKIARGKEFIHLPIDIIEKYCRAYHQNLTTVINYAYYENRFDIAETIIKIRPEVNASNAIVNFITLKSSPSNPRWFDLLLKAGGNKQDLILGKIFSYYSGNEKIKFSARFISIVDDKILLKFLNKELEFKTSSYRSPVMDSIYPDFFTKYLSSKRTVTIEDVQEIKKLANEYWLLNSVHDS